MTITFNAKVRTQYDAQMVDNLLAYCSLRGISATVARMANSDNISFALAGPAAAMTQLKAHLEGVQLTVG